MDKRIPKRRRIERYDGLPLTSLPNEILIKIARCLLDSARIDFVLHADVTLESSEYVDATEIFEDEVERFWLEPPTARYPKSLCQLMKTCKTLHKVVVPIIYEAVDVRTRKQFKNFYSTTMAVKWLQDRVRRLTIATRSPEDDFNDNYYYWVRQIVLLQTFILGNLETLVVGMPGTTLGTFVDLAANMPKLRILSIGGSDGVTMIWGHGVRDWPVLPSVTELHIDRIFIYGDDNNDPNLLNLFPNLKTLALKGVDVRAKEMIGVAPSLETLVLYSRNAKELPWSPPVNSVETIGCFPLLKHLKIDVRLITGLHTWLLRNGKDERWNNLLSVQVLDHGHRKTHICTGGCLLRQDEDYAVHIPVLVDCWRTAHTLMCIAEISPLLKVVQLPGFVTKSTTCRRPHLQEARQEFLAISMGFQDYKGDFDLFGPTQHGADCCRAYQAKRMAHIANELRCRLNDRGVQLLAPDYLEKALLQTCHCKGRKWSELDSEDDEDEARGDNNVGDGLEVELDSEDELEFGSCGISVGLESNGSGGSLEVELNSEDELKLDSDGDHVGVRSRGSMGRQDYEESHGEDDFHAEERGSGYDSIDPPSNDVRSEGENVPHERRDFLDDYGEEDGLDDENGGWQENEVEFEDEY